MITTDQERAALIAHIESQLRERLEMQDAKIGSKKALTIEAHFMSGAMVAINAIFADADPTKISAVIPPSWIIAIMRGSSVLDEKGGAS